MILLPIYNTLILPNTRVYFQTEDFKEVTNHEPTQGSRVLFLMEKEKTAPEDLDENSFYPIGVRGEITEVNDQGYVAIQTNNRVRLNDIYKVADQTFDFSLTRLNDIDDLDSATEAQKVEGIKEAILEFSENTPWGRDAKNFIQGFDSLEQMIVTASPWLTITNEERYHLLEIDSRAKRAEAIEKIMYEFSETAQVQNDAARAQQEDYRKLYKEQAIKKQLDYLQKELDDMHPENVTDIRRMEMRIEESGMNEDARKEAEKALNRLKQEGNNSPEYGMLYDYLDFMTSLAWRKEAPEKIDLKEAEAVLDREHFGLEKIKRRIIQQIAVMNLKKQQSGSILLFVGAPGTGKTSIGKSIADALHRKYVRVSLGGVRDEADIRGHRRTYIGAMPGRIMDGIKKSGVSNPVMVLDEVDKLSSSYNGDPASALLEVLDPEQNSTFTDHYMNVPYDLSDVLFVCTANTMDTIPEPLLDRMEVIRFSGYSASDKLQIAKQHLLPKAMESMGITKDMLEVPDPTIEEIISGYTMESGVRGLKNRLDTLCRSVAVHVEQDDDKKVTVLPDDLSELLDMQPIRHGRKLTETKPGIVTGLAWTSAGGEILFIETLFTKGQGKTIITGQLGDVMKESAQIAISIVKSMFPEKEKLFEENDLHIHVPEGAVPKDGPSAGITLTTALASLVTGKKVDPTVGMTGEVSLRGVVTAIGGLPEKLMAAARAGLKTIYIPEENIRDLKDVPQEVKDQLQIIGVKEVSDVLKANNILDA